ncbi:MAG TPA: hypothetical protein ENJ20_00665 [Bacteroidetes bacterium]|nr:hypothetical protein [Bacteroidota bacterium]
MRTAFSRLFFISVIIFFSCETPPRQEAPAAATAPPATDTNKTAPHQKEATPPPYHFPYRLTEPDTVVKLSKKLVEISGLSLSPDGQSLIAVNDEKGKIYFLDKRTGKILEEVRFGKSGDYEGIESVGKKIYIVKSNGTLYRVKDLKKKKPATKKYDTSLRAKHNVEGLTFDPDHNRLLLACKGKAGEGKDMQGKRAVYGFDLSTRQLSEQPVYLIDRDVIREHFRSGNIAETLLDVFAPEYAPGAFAPSGIAILPKTSDICIISSVGKLFIVLSSSGEVKYIEKLDASVFVQPEGICFDKNGTLYISSEGRGRKAKLFRFLKN